MRASSRTVFGRTFRVTPVWVWMLQRLSGVALGPLVALHMCVPGLASNRALNAVLLVIVLMHGASGLRRLVQQEPRAAAHAVIGVAWCAVVLLFGAMLVLGVG